MAPEIDPQAVPPGMLDDAAIIVADESVAAPPQQRWRHTIVLIGAASLILAMLADGLSVLGRHTGFAVTGSLEIVQICIVVISASSMLLATADRTHAAVHMLGQRLTPDAHRKMQRFAALVAAIVLAVLIVGSLKVSADLWHTAERTEVLGMPLRGFRLLQAGALAGMLLLFLAAAFGPDRK